MTASSLTAVGLSRGSIGPAISVIERGVAGMLVLRHDGDGGERLHAGLADGEHMRAGADRLEEADEVVDIVVDAEAAGLRRGTSRALAQSVM